MNEEIQLLTQKKQQIYAKNKKMYTKCIHFPRFWLVEVKTKLALTETKITKVKIKID